jgi:glycosyltransferase involved in cell wall biosynthesis
MLRQKKKLAIIGTVGLPAKYGGFETLASHLVENLDQEYDMTVYCSGKQYPEADRPANYRGASLKYLPLQANGVQSIPYDTWSILHALFYADVLLILGVAGAWILPFVKLFTNKRIIISIDGIEWKRDKWSRLAKMYLYWAEGMAVKYSHCDISDNESIQDYTAERYGSLSSVIEYGADHTMKVKAESEDISRYPFLAKPYAFKVCRIEPENNLEMVLQAFSSFEKYPLVLVGNWAKSDYGNNLKASYSNHENLILLDPIYDQREIDLLRGNASVYVHGHSAGGTNPSLVEAMYLGLPIMSFGVSYNRTTTEGQAIYFNNTEELISLLQTTSFEVLQQTGKKMKAIADRRYKWNLIARKYQALVEKACSLNHKDSVTPSFQNFKKDVLTDHGAGHLATQRPFYEPIEVPSSRHPS